MPTPIIPDRVVVLSLGIDGSKDIDRQVKRAMLALEREGFRVGPTSDEAILAMAEDIRMRVELELDAEPRGGTT